MQKKLNFNGLAKIVDRGYTEVLERKTCPSCGEQDCNYDCDGSQFDDYNDNVIERIQDNAICDVVESFVLALSPKLSISDIQEVLNTVADAIDNNLG